MSENQTNTPNVPQDASSDNSGNNKPPKKKGGGMATLLALLALILVIAAGVYGYWQLELIKKDLKVQQNDLTNFGTLPAFTDFKKDMSKRIDKLVKEQGNLSGELRQSNELIGAISRNAAKDQRGWILAEVEYLLNIANSRLLLLQDVKSAAEALKGADQRLIALNDPAFLSVRKLLAKEISSLQVIGAPDINGVVLKLSSLAEISGRLPPARTEIGVEEQAKYEDQLSDGSIIADIGRWLGFRRTNQPYFNFNKQSEVFYVDQLVRLELEAARFAAFRYDRDSYGRHLKSAYNQLSKHYDQKSQLVQNLLSELNALRAEVVFPELPDISASSVAFIQAKRRYDGEPAVEAQQAPSNEQSAQEQTL